MKNVLTKEQYERLTPYKNALRSAYRNSFVHVTGTEFNKIAEIYNEIFPPLRKGQMGCNTCRLNALRKLGEMYEEYVEEDHTEKEEKKEESVPEKRKVTRPKKLERNEE